MGLAGQQLEQSQYEFLLIHTSSVPFLTGLTLIQTALECVAFESQNKASIGRQRVDDQVCLSISTPIANAMP
jgi:hypothetical protein